MTALARRLAFDLETTAIGVKPIVVHILVIQDIDTLEKFVFRRNAVMDNIREGIEMLNQASVLIGHNSVTFDSKVLWEVYGDLFHPQGIQRDTMVMVAMIFADQKQEDFKLWKRGTLEGGLIGNHGLAAWGQRLGLDKGDYLDNKLEELKNLYPDSTKEERMILAWSEWNQEMEDYSIRDVEITTLLWKKVEAKNWSYDAIILEHQVHELMGRVQENGFPLNLPEARVLEQSLREKHEELSKIAIEHFGSWWAPSKWKSEESTSYTDPTTGIYTKDLPAFKPRPCYGEDDTREWWGEVTIPKRTVKFKDIMKGDTEQGCAFCPVDKIDFNPNSRTQIINRLQKIYGWIPQEHTEKETPIVNDEVLRDLSKSIPICDELAEIFYYKKRLGQLVDGQNGLIGKAEERGDGKIHARINVGGTVTNRASHSNPNIAQVPRVVFKNLKQWDTNEQIEIDWKMGEIIYGTRDQAGVFHKRDDLRPLLDPFDGKQISGIPVIDKETGKFKTDDTGKVKGKKSLLTGRTGDHGWDFRNLFHVPDGWTLMGADQKGIELRALGHFMAPFDKGDYLKLVVEADPHNLHQTAMELDSRDTAKTFVYAMIYGAQDYKLGITIDPSLALYATRAKNLGEEMRRRLMTRIPALGSVIKAVQREAKRGYIIGLDGRNLYVRGAHSALNTKLQAAAATIAKKWCVIFEQMMEDEGYRHGWDGDFVIVTWVHDEIQVALRTDDALMTRADEICRAAATEAGRTFNFSCNVDIDTKFGTTWAQTH